MGRITKVVDNNILFEGLVNDPIVGRHGKMFASYVGSVEVVDGLIHYGDGDYDYETSLYLAAQLPNGPIVGVKDNGELFSLSERCMQYEIHWGYFPNDFPQEAKTKRKCPAALLPKYAQPACNTAYGITTLDELPF